MQTKQEEKSPIVREYIVGDTKYIVKASVKETATEDAVSKIRRLIQNDIGKQKTQNND